MLTASFTSRFPTRTEDLLLECFSVPTKRLRAHQRQPSFAIVSEIAIGRVDSKERITISSEGTRCAYTVSWATRRNVSSLKRSGKEEWHKTKQGRFPFPISSPFLARSTSISLAFDSPPSHVIIIFLGRGISRLVDFRTTDELSSRFCGHSLWVVCCTMECRQPPTVYPTYLHPQRLRQRERNRRKTADALMGRWWWW